MTPLLRRNDSSATSRHAECVYTFLPIAHSKLMCQLRGILGLDTTDIFASDSSQL